jgi:hypothetical protein
MLKPKSINLIRDLAVRLEATDVEASHTLMEIAYSARPNGEFIEQKLRQYRLEIDATRNHITKIAALQKAGAAAIVPVGFRCFTSQWLRKRIGISQCTHPFDVGFFPPASIASVLRFPRISLDFQDKASFDICKKYENSKHLLYGKGVRFCRSSKEEIDLAVMGACKKKFNRYLDSTFGYYTLDNRHGYVLAHYNWHLLAEEKMSAGCVDMAANLHRASEILNRRIDRMIKACHSASIVIFVSHNPQCYGYMQVDGEVYDLMDLTDIGVAANAAFGGKVHVVTAAELIESTSIRRLIASMIC